MHPFLFQIKKKENPKEFSQWWMQSADKRRRTSRSGAYVRVPPTIAQTAQSGADITTEDRHVTNQQRIGPVGMRKSKVKSNWSVKKRLAILEKNVTPPEKHYTQLVDQVQATITNAGPYLTLLNGCSRGDTVQNRTGDLIHIGKGHLEMILNNVTQTANADTATTVKVAVILDTQSNATALTTTVLLNSATPNTTTPWNFNNYDFWKRFQILHEEVIKLQPNIAGIQGALVVNNDQRFLKFGWDCKEFPADYGGGTAGTIADIRSGALWLLIITDNNTTGVNTRWSSVQYFKDV